MPCSGYSDWSSGSHIHSQPFQDRVGGLIVHLIYKLLLNPTVPRFQWSVSSKTCDDFFMLTLFLSPSKYLSGLLTASWFFLCMTDTGNCLPKLATHTCSLLQSSLNVAPPPPLPTLASSWVLDLICKSAIFQHFWSAFARKSQCYATSLFVYTCSSCIKPVPATDSFGSTDDTKRLSRDSEGWTAGMCWPRKRARWRPCWEKCCSNGILP